MSKLLSWIGIIVALVVADRALLAMEARGWINYRRHGPNLAARATDGDAFPVGARIQQVIESTWSGTRGP